MSHYSLWAVYFIGEAVHVAVKASTAVKSTKRTYKDYFQQNAAALAARLFLATMAFLFWWDDPQLVNNIFDAVASKLPDGTTKAVIAAVNFPLNSATAGIYGYVSDSLLDKAAARFKFLQPEIPPVNGDSQGK